MRALRGAFTGVLTGAIDRLPGRYSSIDLTHHWRNK
jgi:hypothetical protein